MTLTEIKNLKGGFSNRVSQQDEGHWNGRQVSGKNQEQSEESEKD